MTRSQVVSMTLGAILVVAAGLKAHELATRPLPNSGIQNNRLMLTAVVEIEILFGLWMLSGLYPLVARTLGIAWFCGLSAISLGKALNGLETCGCFGTVPVNPWWTTAFNVGAATALWQWPPIRGTLSELRWRRTRIVAGAILAIAICIPVAMFTTSFAPRHSAMALNRRRSVILLFSSPANGLASDFQCYHISMLITIWRREYGYFCFTTTIARSAGK